MQRIPKRDIHGYLIRDELTAERYVFCLKIASLLWLKKCEKCEFFRGTKKYHIRCTCKTESKPPAYYDRKAPNSAGRLFAKMYAKKINKKQ